MPTFKLTSGDKTLKLTTGTKKFRIRTIDLFGINEGGVPIGVAGGDLSGTYPDPNVSGMKETGAGTNLVIGAIADGQTLVRSGGDIVGSPGTPPGGFAGGDLSGTYPDPEVTAMTESSGPASLPIGAIADGDFLVRSGTDIVGAAPGSGISHSSLSNLVSPANDHTQYLGGDGTNAQAVLDLGGNAINDVSVISQLVKVSGSAAASTVRGMTFDSDTGSVDILHGSGAGTPAAGLHMLSLTNRADAIPNSERKIIFTSDPASTLAYDVTNETSTASYSTNISRVAVDRTLSFGGTEMLRMTSGEDMAKFRKAAPPGPSASDGCNVILEHTTSGGVVDSVLRIRSERSFLPLSSAFGEIMATTGNSRLFLGANNTQWACILDSSHAMTMRVGANLDPRVAPWTLEVAPEAANRGIRIFEARNNSVLAFSAEVRGTSYSVGQYAWPDTTAGGTIPQSTGPITERCSVIGLFPETATGVDLDRDLIITASGNMVPSFNDAIKLKNTGGIDIWGDTEFFDTVTSSSFVGPVTGDITGNVVGDVTGDLWGSVYATDGNGPVLTSPATTPGNVAINALGATGIIELNTNSTLALTVDSNQDVHIDGDLYVNGDGTNIPYIILGMGASTAIGLELGHLRTSHGTCHIDFNTSTSVSNCARITRAAESNPLAFDGVFAFVQEGIGDMEFFTNSALAMTIDSSQNVTVGNSASSTFSSKGDAAIGSAVGATLATLSIGKSRSSDGDSILSLHDGAVTGNQFFMKRHDSTTAVSELGWDGAGDFRLTSNNVSYITVLEVHPAGSVDWETAGLNFDIKDSGVLTFRHNNTDTHSIPRLRTDDYILVESTETEPTTFSNYALISTQNTIIASGQWNGIMMAGAGAALDANHFGFTDAYVYVSSGDYELQLDQEVADGCAVICTSNFADPTLGNYVVAYSGIVATVAGGPGNAWGARTWLKISARSTLAVVPKPDLTFSVIVVGPQATWT